MKARSSQRGVGLVEVLVALAILGVVVLGFAAMQMRAVNMTSDSYARTQAMAIAQDMIERMSINYTATNNYLSEFSAGSAPPPASTLANACSATACSVANIAKNDVAQVNYYATTLLPEGLIYLRRDSGKTNNLQVFVAWGGTNPAPGIADNACMTLDADGELGVKAEANCVMVESPLVEVL